MLKQNRGFWRQWGKTLFNPAVDEQQVQQKLNAVKRQLPVPVFWLLGKTQSGKTSLIRALTGRSDAEIGNGFQACTQRARIYDFPDRANCVLRFLDTRGLGEVDYEPEEDMRLYAAQAHVLIVVLQVNDQAQQAVLDCVRKIHGRFPRWPIIVVQTQLHALYPNADFLHIEPYPYNADPWPAQIPVDLQRSLLAQRNAFAGIEAQFVALDFTLPDDGYAPENYGLEALWAGLETALPLGLRSLLIEDKAHRNSLRDIYAATAHPQIISYALLAGGVAVTPLPFISIPLVLTVQGKMLQALASIYQQPLDGKRLSEMAGALGIGYLLGMGGRELAKLVPGYGSALASLYNAVATYALGKTVGVYFSRVRAGDIPDPEVFAAIYKQELLYGREILNKYMQAMQRS